MKSLITVLGLVVSLQVVACSSETTQNKPGVKSTTSRSESNDPQVESTDGQNQQYTSEVAEHIHQKLVDSGVSQRDADYIRNQALESKLSLFAEKTDLEVDPELEKKLKDLVEAATKAGIDIAKTEEDLAKIQTAILEGVSEKIIQRQQEAKEKQADLIVKLMEVQNQKIAELLEKHSEKLAKLQEELDGRFEEAMSKNAEFEQKYKDKLIEKMEQLKKSKTAPHLPDGIEKPSIPSDSETIEISKMPKTSEPVANGKRCTLSQNGNVFTVGDGNTLLYNGKNYLCKDGVLEELN